MKEFTQEQIKALSAFVDSERFSVGRSSRKLHLQDISPHCGTIPAGVMWPETTEEVAKILSWTYDQNTGDPLGCRNQHRGQSCPHPRWTGNEFDPDE